ncbi:uncharacterized protein [Lepeophtheirus salmonis]|uniref:uncharacterized protein n=1 Tax=Lepeophtheirus salmonis TaxID=72036 RepID=UPI001AE0EAF7|nr:uncharacterized protein LOC121126038 [Lepeophtheirus salmonis]
MPSKCCALGCRTGYGNTPQQSGVTIHLWPNKERTPRLDIAWLRSIPRETDLKKTDEAPSKSTKLRSLHFNDSDFISESKRSQTLGKALKKRYLKPDVVPSLWSNCPNYLSTPKAPSRPTQAASTSPRAQQFNELQQHAVFHKSSIGVLKYYSKEDNRPEFKDTAEFSEFVRTMWNILNVKAPGVGYEKRDKLREPISEKNKLGLSFWKDFVDFLIEWQNSKAPSLRNLPTNKADVSCCSRSGRVSSRMYSSACSSPVPSNEGSAGTDN